MARNVTVTFDDGSQHVYQNAPDDVTPEMVTERASREFGKTVTALDGGRNAQPVAESAPPIETPQAAPRESKLKLPEKAPRLSGDGSAASYLKQGTRSGLQGATLGWADEIGAAIAAPVYKAGEKLGLLPETNQPVLISEEGNPSLYSQMQAQSDAEQKQFAKEYPVADIAGQVGGGLIPAALTGGNTIAAQTLPQLAGRGALQGAAYGAGYGAGSAEQGIGNRLTGGAVGATIGALTGGVLAPAINVAGKGVGALVNAYQELATRTPRQKAELLLQGVVKEAGYTPEQLAQRVNALGSKGTLADASENMLSVADQAVSKIGTTKEAARELVKARNKGEQADVLAVLGKQLGVGSADDIAIALEANAKRMSEEARPLYEKAFASGVQVPVTPKQQAILAMPEMQGLLSQAEKRAAGDVSRVVQNADGTFSSKALTDMERLHYGKMVLDDAIAAAKSVTNPQPAQARALMQQKQVLDDILNQNPDYLAARNTWAGGSAVKEAADFGADFFKYTSKPDEFIKKVSSMTQHEKDVARMAMLKAATDKAGSEGGNRSLARTLIGEDNNVNRRKMLAALAGDDAVKELEANAAKWGRFRRTSSAIEGSRTAERLNTKESLDGAEAVLNPRGFVVNKLMETLTPNGRRMADPAVTNELGNILMTQGMPESEIVRILTPAPTRPQVAGKAVGQVMLPAEQVALDRLRK